MIKWHVKYFLAAILGLMPFRHYLHFKAQCLLGGAKLDEEEMLSRAIELYSLVFTFKKSLYATKVLELGTGWFPYMPIVAFLFGARDIVTVDLNPWLSNETLRKTIKSILDKEEKIKVNLNFDSEILNSRFSVLKSIYNDNCEFRLTLDRLGIKYLSNYNVCNLEVDEKFDVILSSNVLEHIEINALSKIHAHLLNVVSDKGIAVHRYNPADHYAYLSGSTISFLTVPDWLWRFYRQGGIAYHNRLRTREHASLVSNNDWVIKLWADAIDNKAVELLEGKKVNLNNRYNEMDLDEICAYYSWFVLSKLPGNSCVKPKKVKWITEVI